MNEQRRTFKEVPLDNKAEIGRKFFNYAANRHPKSNTKQGALIAILCKKSRGYTPEMLVKPLLDNDTELGKIRTAAIARHKGNPNAPQEDELTLERVGWTVEANFLNASDFMILDIVDLEQILSCPTPKNQGEEDKIFAYATSLLNLV